MTQTHVRSTQCKKSKEKKKTRNPVKLLSKSLCFRVKIENSAKLNSQPRNHQKIPHSSPEKPNLSNGYGIGNKKQRRSEQWFSPAKEKKPAIQCKYSVSQFDTLTRQLSLSHSLIFFFFLLLPLFLGTLRTKPNRSKSRLLLNL